MSDKHVNFSIKYLLSHTVREWKKLCALMTQPHSWVIKAVIYLFLAIVFVKALTSHKHINFNEAAYQTKWNSSLHKLRF
jgi:hypothetical protein